MWTFNLLFFNLFFKGYSNANCSINSGLQMSRTERTRNSLGCRSEGQKIQTAKKKKTHRVWVEIKSALRSKQAWPLRFNNKTLDVWMMGCHLYHRAAARDTPGRSERYKHVCWNLFHTSTLVKFIKHSRRKKSTQLTYSQNHFIS